MINHNGIALMRFSLTSISAALPSHGLWNPEKMQQSKSIYCKPSISSIKFRSIETYQVTNDTIFGIFSAMDVVPVGGGVESNKPINPNI